MLIIEIKSKSYMKSAAMLSDRSGRRNRRKMPGRNGASSEFNRPPQNLRKDASSYKVQFRSYKKVSLSETSFLSMMSKITLFVELTRSKYFWSIHIIFVFFVF